MLKQDMDISPATLRELMSYSPDTGLLVWRWRDESYFKGKVGQRDRWNKMYAGTLALNAVHKDGYRHGHVLTRALLAHRVAWAIQTGAWPIGQIDHINGERSDNRFVNIRSVTAQENARNQKVRSRNTSGVMGVKTYRPGMWRAAIEVDGKRKHLGVFDNFEDAVNARKEAEREYGYHENHNR